MQVETGHKFPEVIDFLDRRVGELGERLIVASRAGLDRPAAARSRRPGRGASRNRLQTTTLLDAIAEHDFDAAFGGARRDEERARAKERMFSFRDDIGQWDPKNQRPELWNLYNGRIKRGEHVRVFPISNWTELDVWEYIAAREARAAVDLLRPRARGLPPRRDALRGLASTSSADRDVHDLGALPHRRRHDRHRRRRVDRGDAARRSSPRSPRRGSPSAARRAPTTASPRPRWRTASGRATSRWPPRRRHRSPARPRPAREATASCCASPPPARSTTASRR